MDHCDVVIVGGGPAGSSCAWRLRKHGIPSLILEAREFPRTKLCAGWITPAVVRDLEIDLSTYPYSLATLDKIRVEYYGKRTVHRLELKTTQYSIRRCEFDHWLLQRSQARVELHAVREIHEEKGAYVIDGRLRCRFLVGAGGTHCPVYRAFFKELNPRSRELQIGTVEEEFPCPDRDGTCRLWFAENGLAGYAWYVPKGNGWANVGLGAWSRYCRQSSTSLNDHWKHFTRKLADVGLIPPRDHHPGGYTYFARSAAGTGQRGNCFIIGDAAGLATRDLGEGIGPAVESGIYAAEAIAGGAPYSFKGITRHSWPGFVRGYAMRLFALC